ncbi:MAG: M15 family peptidase [Proteobacteria bacterium]|nr:M15 family peptidase [Pseudomonadota bacterium]
MEFMQAAALLIQKVKELGYDCTGGDLFRSPQQAAQNAADGTGVTNSLHCDRLAIDLNLFKDGQYITDDTGHRDLGAWWKTLTPSVPGAQFKWGGDIVHPRADPNHYSLSPDGVRA